MWWKNVYIICNVCISSSHTFRFGTISEWCITWWKIRCNWKITNAGPSNRSVCIIWDIVYLWKIIKVTRIPTEINEIAKLGHAHIAFASKWIRIKIKTWFQISAITNRFSNFKMVKLIWWLVILTPPLSVLGSHR